MERALSSSRLDTILARAERSTALLERVLPRNLQPESERLVAAFRAGRPEQPVFIYGPGVELSPVIRALEVVISHLEGGGPWATLYRDRALELSLEARIAEARGRPSLRPLAERRFRVEPNEAAAAEHLAFSWIGETDGRERERIFSDDPQDSRSLLNQIRKLVSERRLPVRVLTRTGLACFAATGDSVIVVRAGDRLTEEASRRIAIHEVFGHALPRYHAGQQSVGLFTTGTRGGSEDEEGRALLLEQRHGLLGSARKRELALRHLLALAVRRGADFVETVRVALAHEVSIEVAVSTALRVHRGGGLAREIVYLPALGRVRDAFASEPALEWFLERGRIGVSAARDLSRLSSDGRNTCMALRSACT